MPTLWPTPVASQPISGSVTLPGSKSITNRALVLAALAESPTSISGALFARDSLLMMQGLRALGVGISGDEESLEVRPGALRPSSEIDCGLAGTVMRFLAPVAALSRGEVRFKGDPRAQSRPLAPLIKALRDLNVKVDGEQLPITVHGKGQVTGREAFIDAHESSQFVSALLLSAARFQHGITLHHDGKPLPSLPHLDMTVSMLKDRGVDVKSSTSDPTQCTWEVRNGPIRGGKVVVEPDLSNAGPFLAAAMITQGKVVVNGWPRTTTQAGDALRSLFERMGARVSLDEQGLVLEGPSHIGSIDADMSQVGELVPTVAAVAAFAEAPSRITGVAHLRGHETDRLVALSTELNRLGCHVRELTDGLEIDPRPMTGAALECYDDHRMATFGAIIGLRVPGVELTDVGTTDKTLPAFPQMWLGLCSGDSRLTG